MTAPDSNTTTPAGGPPPVPHMRDVILAQAETAAGNLRDDRRVLLLGLEVGTMMWPAPDGSANPAATLIGMFRGVALTGPDAQIISWRMLPSWMPADADITAAIDGMTTDVENLRASLMPPAFRHANGTKPGRKKGGHGG